MRNRYSRYGYRIRKKGKKSDGVIDIRDCGALPLTLFYRLRHEKGITTSISGGKTVALDLERRI